MSEPIWSNWLQALQPEQLEASYQVLQGKPPEVIAQLVEHFEDLGFHSGYLAELQLLLAHRPQDAALLRSLIEGFRDAAHWQQAEQYYQTLCNLQPLDVELWYQRCQMHWTQGNRDQALELLAEAVKITQDIGLKAKLTELRHKLAARQQGSSGPSGEALQLFVSLFSGREGVYARQWAKPPNESGYVPVHEPWTVQVARQHLQGRYTVGIYPLRLDDTVLWMALDFDLPTALCKQTKADQQTKDVAMAKLLRTARAYQALASELGLHNYLEESGSKGFHLWVFFQEPVPARAARRLGLAWCQAAKQREIGLTPDIGRLEVFPKQAHLQPKELGNLVKLPLGVHQLTGKNSRWLDTKGEPIADGLYFLTSIRRNTHQILSLFGPVEDEDELSDLAKAVPVEPYNESEDLELQTMLSRCAVVRSLWNQATQTKRLSHDELIVLSHTLGHLRFGPEAVNLAFEQCPEIDQRYYLKGRFRGNPISCPKIRQRLPYLTRNLDCNCTFQNCTTYPNPVQHLAETLTVGQLETAQFRSLVKDYIQSIADLQSLEARIGQYAQEIARILKSSGASHYEWSGQSVSLNESEPRGLQIQATHERPLHQ